MSTSRYVFEHFPVHIIRKQEVQEVQEVFSRCFKTSWTSKNGNLKEHISKNLVLVKGHSLIRRLHLPLLQPEDVIRHLAKQEAHWRSGYSAQELAMSWANAGTDFPRCVREVLNTAPE